VSQNNTTGTSCEKVDAVKPSDGGRQYCVRVDP